MIRIVLTSDEAMADVLKDKQGFNAILPYLILGFGIIFIITLLVMVYQNYRERQLWNKSGYSKKRTIDKFNISCYRFLKNFPITRGYIEKISYRYRFISPCDTKLIAKNTLLTCLLSWSLCFLTFIFLYVMNPRLISLIYLGVAIVLINNDIIGRITKRFEITVLEDTQKMISICEHNYYIDYRVDDALYRAMEGLSPSMKVAAQQIYELLLSDDKEDALREYYENIPNKYLRAFVSQCVSIMERGDQKIDGKFMFIKNLEYIYREIDIEIDKLQKLNMEFMGVIFCVIAPIFCIDVAKQFAIDLKESMESFFYGKEGFMIDLALLLLISCIYVIMRKSAEYVTFYQPRHRWLHFIDKRKPIKKAMDNYCDKNASRLERLKKELRNNGNSINPRHFILRSFLFAAITFVFSIGIMIYLHEVSKEQLMSIDKAEVELLTSAANDSQYESMTEVIHTYTNKYVKNPNKLPKTTEDMVVVLEKDGAFYNKVINEALATDIMRRVHAYQKEYFSFIDLFMSLFISSMAYYIPYILLKYNSAVSRDAMVDEVNRFIAVICMMMHDKSVTVKQILEEMESFAVVFKQSLRICINDYGSGDIQALNELIERESYEPFTRIIDNLIRCDEMPISEAFHEADIEREGYMARRKLANEKSIRKRVRRAYMLAALPFFLLFVYIFLPTLISSMNEIQTMMEALDSYSW